jgi:pimeloyl-ACP methyl ester carboxylesterase
MTFEPPDGRIIEVAGVRTFVIERGKGPTVVLLHGASLAVDAWLTWFRTITALAADFRVVTFDQVGFGRSGHPPDNRYLNRLERIPHAWAVLDALAIERAILVGHSEGAFMAARMTVDRPDRVAKLALVTSGGTAPRLGGALDHQWIAASKAAYDVTGATATEDGAVAADPHLRRGPDAEYEAILRENFRRALRSGSHAMFQNLPPSEVDYGLYLRLQEQHLFRYLATLRCPPLLVWARQDATVPVERALKLMDLIPGAALHVLPDAAHMVMHDQPTAFNRLLRGWCVDAA